MCVCVRVCVSRILFAKLSTNSSRQLEAKRCCSSSSSRNSGGDHKQDARCDFSSFPFRCFCLKVSNVGRWFHSACAYVHMCVRVAVAGVAWRLPDSDFDFGFNQQSTAACAGGFHYNLALDRLC